MRTKYLSAVVVAVSLYLSACTPAPTIENFNNAITSGDLKDLQAIHSQDFLGQAKNKEAVDNALLAATKSANYEVVKFLIDSGYPLNNKNADGYAPLSLAAHNVNLNILKVLLDAGADVNVRNKRQSTPLMIAVNSAKSPSLVSALLAAGADVNASNEDGWTALHITANIPDEPTHDLADIAKLLLDAGANKEAKPTNGQTPLAFAASNNKPNTLKVLLDAGANVNARDKLQLTPLMRAVYGAKSPSLVSALLAAGADVNATDEAGWTALHLTVYDSDEPTHDLADIAKLLLDAGANKEAKTMSGNTPLAFAAINNKANTLKVLLDAGADVNVNARKVSQWTPLMQAVNYAKSPSMVRALLAAGADVNATLESGWTALHLTVNNSDEPTHDLADIAKLLLDAGANKEAKSTGGSTPLTLAASNNRPNTLKVLLDAGADVNARNKRQRTPLMYAVNNAKSASLVSELLAAGADVNAGDKRGLTALHFTVNDEDETSHDLADIAKLLLDAGANKEAKTISGNTPLALAASYNKPNTLEVLLDAGADVNARNKRQRTPLMYAVNNAKSASLVSELLAAGADVNAGDKRGLTALHFTVNDEDETSHDLADIAKLLLDAGANKEARLERGLSALMMAGEFNKPKVARVLVDFGASLNSTHRSSGKSALDFALENSNAEVISVLRSAGAISAIEDAKYPTKPAPRAGYLRCNTRCNNGDCYRTYSDGEKVRFQAQRKYNPFSGQWEFDSGSC